MRGSMALAAAACVALAAPALAITPEEADCPAQLAPAGLGKLLIDDIGGYKRNGTKDQRVEQGLEQTFTACADKLKIPAAERDKYRFFTSIRIGRDEVVSQMRAMGLKPELIDQKLDLGPGRTNREMDQITDKELSDLTDALVASGVTRKKLDGGGATLVGYYIMLTGTMHRLME